jgi:hypothetical protein
VNVEQNLYVFCSNNNGEREDEDYMKHTACRWHRIELLHILGMQFMEANKPTLLTSFMGSWATYHDLVLKNGNPNLSSINGLFQGKAVTSDLIECSWDVLNF